MHTDQLAALLLVEMAPLRRFAIFLTRSAEDAEDLTQDTVERALKKAHLFQEGNLRAWLFTICRRIFLNGLRKVKSRGDLQCIDDAPPEAVSVQSDQEETLDFRRTMAALDQLSKRDREILDLIAFKGAPYEETARSLNVPIGTIRSRLSRARARLRATVDRSAPIYAGAGKAWPEYALAS